MMPDNSVDAVVSDPPYGLSFMNKEWDSFGSDTRQPCDEHYVTPDNPYGRSKARYGYGSKLQKSMQEFQFAMTPVFEEALRVAKPGAHLLCFGGTRTFHRMACAIEDAGWEVRDCIMWVYGCLDEETEVLVDGEFVPYNKAKIGSLALGYDIERGTFSWQRIEDTYLYDYDDTAYAIQSDCTDQLVSRNHRCIVERGGVEQFALAEQVARERQTCVPVLEGLQGLLDRLPMPDEGTSITQQDVLEGMRGEGGESRSKEAQCARAEHDMPSMREGVLHTDGMEAEGKDKLLLEELQGQGGERTKATGVQQGTPNANVRGAEASPQRANDGATESNMEGRGDIPSQPRELQRREIRQVSQGVLGDGTQGRLRDGAQACGGPSDREATDKAGMRASRKSRPVGQQAGESDAVPVERGSQALRELWGAKTTLARVTPVHYKGKMWCVKVRTGAFVARRHGKIFITGNSGFPKSMDVAKAIDKHLGVKQKVVGHRETDPQKGFSKVKGMGTGAASIGDETNSTSYDLTEATSDEARTWEGWGTCLKPAWEPIIVARKPLDGTVAHNVLTWGVGALNIDACRVEYESESDKEQAKPQGAATSKAGALAGKCQNGAARTEFVPTQKKGRFPANLVHDGSQLVLDLFPQSKGQQGDVTGNEPSHPADGVCYGEYNGRHTFAKRGDTGSAARFFNTFRDGEESAERTYADKGSTSFAAKPGMRRVPADTPARFFYCAKASKKDRGEGNVHPTVKPTALMEWLVNLVTTRGGVVLDPFMGSGSTGVACANLGRRFVGIEREWEYMQIAGPRVQNREREVGMLETD